MAAIAHPPTRADDPKTLTAYRAIGRFMIDGMLQAVPAVAGRILPFPEDMIRMSSAEAKRIYEQANRLVRRRIAAADVLQPRIESAEDCFYKRKIRYVSVKTLDRTIQDYTHEQRETVEKAKKLGEPVSAPFSIGDANFEHRVIRESLPVIHLASGIIYSLYEVFRDVDGEIGSDFNFTVDRAGCTDPEFGYHDLLFHPKTQEVILKEAERLEPVVALAQPASRRGWIRVRESNR